MNEHEMVCEGCGKIIDCRDLGVVLSHGWIENGEIVCYPEIDVEYKPSRKIGESVQYLKNIDQMNLN